MNRNDEQLISQFMQANKHEIADNGFSRRVMRRLPQSAKVWSDILTAICVVLCCTLIYVYDGVTILFQSVYEIFQSQSEIIIKQSNNLPVLLMACATITLLSLWSVWTIKE